MKDGGTPSALPCRLPELRCASSVRRRSRQAASNGSSRRTPRVPGLAPCGFSFGGSNGLMCGGPDASEISLKVGIPDDSGGDEISGTNPAADASWPFPAELLSRVSCLAARGGGFTLTRGAIGCGAGGVSRNGRRTSAAVCGGVRWLPLGYRRRLANHLGRFRLGLTNFRLFRFRFTRRRLNGLLWFLDWRSWRFSCRGSLVYDFWRPERDASVAKVSRVRRRLHADVPVLLRNVGESLSRRCSSSTRAGEPHAPHLVAAGAAGLPSADLLATAEASRLAPPRRIWPATDSWTAGFRLDGDAANRLHYGYGATSTPCSHELKGALGAWHGQSTMRERRAAHPTVAMVARILVPAIATEQGAS